MSEDVRHIIGSNVRRLRKAAGVSQAELANRMGVDRAYVSGLELGQRNPTAITLWHLAEALDVQLVDLVAAPARTRPKASKATRK